MATHPTSVHPYVLQANEGEAIWYTTTRMTLKATSESTGGALSLVEVLAAPETAPPWHIHHRDSEMFYILEGSFLFLPGGMPHSFKVVSETAARFLVLGIPAGLDRYFVDSGIPAIEEGLRPQPVDPVQMVAIAARHGIEILGPPPF